MLARLRRSGVSRRRSLRLRRPRLMRRRGSADFDRQLDDVFAIPREISDAVAVDAVRYVDNLLAQPG